MKGQANQQLLEDFNLLLFLIGYFLGKTSVCLDIWQRNVLHITAAVKNVFENSIRITGFTLGSRFQIGHQMVTTKHNNKIVNHSKSNTLAR